MSTEAEIHTFPPPGHDHDHCVGRVVGRAEESCARRGVRFTDQRRRVLAAIAQSHCAIGAYEIIERMAESGTRPAPITVYRALDFLMAQGFVHRIASRNAFVTCMRQHHGEAAVFLICNACGTIGEMEADPVLGVVDREARGSGFAVEQAVIEISGQCRECLDHDDTGSERSVVMNVIGADRSARDAGGKPVPAFPHPARGDD